MFPVVTLTYCMEYGRICVKIFIMNQYISKSYTMSKNTIDQQYTERRQLSTIISYFTTKAGLDLAGLFTGMQERSIARHVWSWPF